MKILSSLTYPKVLPKHDEFLFSAEHKRRFFWRKLVC